MLFRSTLTTLLGLLPMTGWLDPFIPAVQFFAKGVDAAITPMVEGLGRSMTAPADWKLIGGWKFSFERAVGFLVGGSTMGQWLSLPLLLLGLILIWRARGPGVARE